MSEMRRLRDETRSPFTRALLDSVKADRSANGACDRALRSLGFGTAAMTASAAAKAMALGGVAKGVGALSGAPAAAKGGALLLVQWIGIGTLGGAVAIASAPYAERVMVRAQQSARSSSVSLHRREANKAAASSVEEPLAPVDSPTIAPAPIPSPPTPSPPVKPLHPPRALDEANRATASAATTQEPAPSVVPVATDSIATQLETLKAIRASLGVGAPERALILLDDFQRRYPSSPLVEEATVLRIDALVDARRGTEATRLAEAFLSAHPSSAYAQRVRSKLKSP